MKRTLSLLLTALFILSLSSALADKIVIGATPLPHALILEFIKPDFEALGHELEINEGSDYYIFNPALADGDTDANFFQHAPFLESTYNNEASAEKKLYAAFGVHYEPLGLFPGKIKTLEEVKEGAEIAVPNDPSNQTRALLLLQQIGWITLPEDSFEKGATVDSILENKYNLKINDMNAELIPNSLQDVDYAIINGNYAIAAGFTSAAAALATESADSEAGTLYTNIVVIREADKDKQWVKDLQTVMQSDKIKEYILSEPQFAGAMMPSF